METKKARDTGKRLGGVTVIHVSKGILDSTGYEKGKGR
jgi:hypothetical protein